MNRYQQIWNAAKIGGRSSADFEYEGSQGVEFGEICIEAMAAEPNGSEHSAEANPDSLNRELLNGLIAKTIQFLRSDSGDYCLGSHLNLRIEIFNAMMDLKRDSRKLKENGIALSDVEIEEIRSLFREVLRAAPIDPFQIASAEIEVMKSLAVRLSRIQDILNLPH